MNSNIKNYIDTSVKKVNTLAHNGYVANEGRIADLENKVALLEEAAVNDLFTTTTDSTKAVRKSIPNKALSNFYMSNLGGCPSKSSNLFRTDLTSSDVEDSTYEGWKFNPSGKTMTISVSLKAGKTIPSGIAFGYGSSPSAMGGYSSDHFIILSGAIKNATKTTTDGYLCWYPANLSTYNSLLDCLNIMVNVGSTALAHEDYYPNVKLNYPTSVDMYKSNPTDLTHPLVYGTNTAQYILVKESIASNQVVINGTSLSFAYNGKCYYRDASSIGIDFYINGKLRSSVSGDWISKDYDVINFGNTITFNLSSNGVGKIFDVTKVTTLLSSEMFDSLYAKSGVRAWGGQLEFGVKKWKNTMNKVNAWDLSWTYEGNNLRFFSSLTHKAVSHSEVPNILCNIYTTINANSFDTNVDMSIRGHNSGNYIWIRDTNFTDVASFKAYLQANNVVIYYEMATEELIDCSDILQDVPTNDYGMIVRGAEANGSIVFNNDNNLPIPSSETYLIKTV